MRKTKIKESYGDKIFNIVNVSILGFVVVICLYPMYLTVIASVSDILAVNRGEVLLLPKGFTLDVYKNIFKYKILWTGYRNSIMYTVLGTLWQLILTIPCGYAMSKKNLKGKNIFLLIFFFTMYFSGGMIPTYLLMGDLNLIDTIWVMILPAGMPISNMIVVRTFFASTIPDALPEAAKIDGASEFLIFLRIIIPISGAIIAVQALFFAVAHWNSYYSALLYLNSKELHPLQLVLRNILVLNQQPSVDFDFATVEELNYEAKRAKMVESMKYGIIFVASAPVLIAYPFVQKYFVKGVMIGSLKG